MQKKEELFAFIPEMKCLRSEDGGGIPAAVLFRDVVFMFTLH